MNSLIQLLGEPKKRYASHYDKDSIKLRLSDCCKHYVVLSCDSGCTVKKPRRKCGIRICPVCANYRLQRIYAKYMPLALNYKSPWFVTLTYRGHRALNREQKQNFDHDLFVLFRRYRRQGIVNFYIRALEIVRKHDGFYYHYHIIYDGLEIKRSQLTHDWYDITGHSYITDIQEVKQVSDVMDYILKYVTKCSTLSVSVEEYRYFYKVRYIAVVGMKIPKRSGHDCKVCSSPIRYVADR